MSLAKTGLYLEVIMQTKTKCLLAQRKDGKFLRLDEQRNTTSYDFVDEPELAKRIILWASTTDDDYKNPKEATWYFENSDRARRYWLVDCKMVAYEITTDVVAEKI
jgi:hypothetical protein